MAKFTVLDQAEEDKLHATRLLGIEERPFKRLTKRLVAPTTPINAFLSRPSSSDETTAATDPAEQHKQFLKDIHRFREDVILDFAAFESSIARIQFLRSANERERERYAAEKLKIEATAEEVRENTTNLRVQLDEAQKTLAIRKTYDVLADKITQNPALKPRDEQHVNIEKLKAEIEELEREAQEHKQAWLERREQLAKVVHEGLKLRRLMRDEKEPERDDETEQTQEAGEHEHEHEHDDDNMLGVGYSRDGISNAGTPRPIDDASTPLATVRGSGALTPRSTLPEGRGTPPQHERDEDVDMDGGADVDAGPGAGNEDGHAAANTAAEKIGDGMDTS
ncbi:hypothetical protein A1O3_09057 [Capronia epimyces CBS 606.96]|uniref:Tho complex subunit 7 n=1 Tax=Capronia epimyces CBS 606.96 TaxID=1182542 RepID=W9XCH5_9EURO|nr:uncharacterized protein A1O3_09057 [Capronia epimyces CBS 606.96]EXJ77898.1 hypothetical protein A1O3_09057 [Capronia epimyces CBS 606.96]